MRKGLCGLPQDDIEERLTFYSEMIDDRIEEGFSERQAVLQIGSVDEIVKQSVSDIPLTKLVKEKIAHKKKLKDLEIVLIVLGSPIWISLLIAAFAVVFSLYISLWSVIISLWAVFVSLVGCAFGGIAAGIGFTFGNNGLVGVAVIGAGIALAGLSIFWFFGSEAATSGLSRLTKKILSGIKNRFLKREEA